MPAVATQPSLGSRTPVLAPEGAGREPSSSTRNRLILSRSRSVTMRLALTLASVVLSPCRGIRLIAGVAARQISPAPGLPFVYEVDWESTTADSTRKQPTLWLLAFGQQPRQLANLVIRLAELGVSQKIPSFWSSAVEQGCSHSPLPHMVEQQRYSPQTFQRLRSNSRDRLPRRRTCRPVWRRARSTYSARTRCHRAWTSSCSQICSSPRTSRARMRHGWQRCSAAGAAPRAWRSSLILADLREAAS